MNRDLKCLRCGACCGVDMVVYITTEDFQRWEREQRHDILARVRDDDIVWAGDRITDGSGERVTTCRFLKRDASPVFCEIYSTRPLVCRNYIPGSSELCPQYFRNVAGQE